MDAKERTNLDKWFEEARNVPIMVSFEEVKATLVQEMDSSASKKPSYLNGLGSWTWMGGFQLAASLIFIMGLSFIWKGFDIPGSDPKIDYVGQVGEVDTFMGGNPGFWDTAFIHYTPETYAKNIRCFEAYLADTACSITVALELGQPDLVNFFLADVTGTIVQQLLSHGNQRQADSSYIFDLCHFRTGDYELVVHTDTGDQLKKQLVLN